MREKVANQFGVGDGRSRGEDWIRLARTRGESEGDMFLSCPSRVSSTIPLTNACSRAQVKVNLFRPFFAVSHRAKLSQ